MFLNNLAGRLSARYDQLGAREDLDEAIVLDRAALDLRPQGHPLRSTSLHNLAADLSARYEQLGASMRPLSLAENRLTFARRGTPVDRDHWKTLHATSAIDSQG